MRASKANLECADVVLRRNNLRPEDFPLLRRDIALTIDIAEEELRKRLTKYTIKKRARKVKGTTT